MKRLKLMGVITAISIRAGCSCNQRAHQKKEVISNNVRIDYNESGTGDTTLLFVHGWCLNKTYWDQQLSHFSDRYRVVAIDLPGYGKSGKNRDKWNTASFGEDIKDVILQLGLKNVVLVGHSMAGDIVLQGAIDCPDRVIAIVGVDNFKQAGVPAKADSVQAKKDYADAIKAMIQNFKLVAIPYFEQSLFSKTTSKAIRERILRDVTRVDTVIATACMAQDNFDEGAKLLQLKKMLYLINSDYAPTDTSGLVMKKIPYRLYQVHATGHFPMIEAPGSFNTLLSKVMSDISRSTAF